MKKKHANIPIFIPHLGCPNDCVFCNQRKISGKTEYTRASVAKEIDDALLTINKELYDIEIAFFGGSFTGIDRDEMIWLLDLAQSYIDSGKADSIRLSTRPDYINGEIIEILSRYSVKVVELGIQSMNDNVLFASKRGHTSKDSEKACSMLKSAGFNVIGQMMTGLPQSTLEDEINTAKKICELNVDGARIYSTVVFHDTQLKEMTESGSYTPLTDDEAIIRAGEVLGVFVSADIPVIRIGLCSTDNLVKNGEIFAGSYHSAFGELVENYLYLKNIKDALKDERYNGKSLTVYTAPGCISKAVGQKRSNAIKLKEEFNFDRIFFKESETVSGHNIAVKISERNLTT